MYTTVHMYVVLCICGFTSHKTIPARKNIIKAQAKPFACALFQRYLVVCSDLYFTNVFGSSMI